MALNVDGIPISGSTGNKTYSRNRYGAYTRRRTVPVNPNSAKQNRARMAFRAAVEAWGSTLNSTQRSTWNNWAAATPWLNKVGQSVRLTGQAAFIRSASAWLQSGIVLAGNYLLPPIQNDVGAIDVTMPTGELEITTATQTITTGALAAPAGSNSSGVTSGNFSVEISPGYNPQTIFAGNRFTGLTAAAGPLFNYGWVAGVIDLSGVALGLPWAFQAGQVCFLRVRGLGDNNAGAERRVTTKVTIGPLLIVET